MEKSIILMIILDYQMAHYMYKLIILLITSKIVILLKSKLEKIPLMNDSLMKNVNMLQMIQVKKESQLQLYIKN